MWFKRGHLDVRILCTSVADISKVFDGSGWALGELFDRPSMLGGFDR